MELVTTFADQAVIAIENVRLFDEVQARTRELEEALEYQTATGDVLNVISRSPAQIQPVLDAIVETARRLCDAYDAVILLREGEFLSVASHRGPIPVDIAKWPISRGWVTGRAIVDGKPMHVADLQAAAEEFPDGHAMAMRQGHRTLLATPLLREEVAIGAIVIRRTEVRPFSEKQIAVLQTFADQAVIAIENARLFEEVQTRTAELQESLEYQTATSEVLNVISRSPSDIQPVLDAIAETAQRLCQAENVFIMRKRNGLFHLASHRNASPEQVEFLTDHPLTPDRGSVCGRVALERRTIHLPDCLADPEYELRQSQKLGNYRATLGIPLLRDGFVLGVIILTRSAVHSFAEKQIELVETFADQAVIAIENVRLFDEVNARTAELAEALGYQTATSDVLNVISRSPSELQPVLEAIVQTAAGLCSAEYAFIAKCDGEICELVAANRMQAKHIQYLARKPIAIDRGSVTGRVALEHSTVHIVDVLADPDFKHLEWQRVGRQRTVLGVPLMREGVLLGAILLARTEVAPFSDKQIELVTTFADQAVIAIENARLFEEVQTRTAELTEALEQQTATSEVLQVISRSAFDLQTVLDTLVQSAARLGDADIGTITRQRDGSFFREALYGFSDEFIEYVRAIPVRPEKGNISGRALLEGKIVQIEDVERDPDYTWDEAKRTGRYRTLLGVPLVRHGKPIGVMALGRREVRPFNQREIDLVTTFADQAVIAIENVRLFDEVQARTRDLEELLQQQTATAEVLKVISRSTFELQPVLDTLVESAARLCEADMAAVARQTGTAFHYAATFGYSPELKAYLVGIPHTPGAGSIIGRTLEGGSTVHVADVLADPNYRLRDVQEKAGYRTVLCVPLLRERTPIGVVVLTRRAVRPFTDKQIELVTTFADQAVIAIENVRLFDEVQARTGELAKSVGELQALGEVSQAVNSTLDLETVLKTIVAKAVQLSATDAGAIYVFSKLRQKFRLRATYGMSDAMIAEIGKQGGVRLGESYIGAAAESGQAVQVPDLMTEAASPMRDLILGAGYRGLLVVPLLRPGGIVGALVVRRKEPGAFPASTIDLLQTFAAQSVVAIQNARLFEDVEARTRELAKSLEELRAAQERLIQTEKLASLGQLTAGIAHEIKNPLNFVNNFAALSIELIDELKDAIRSTPPDEEQAAELMALLAGNLGKVVQHGKRADSIVKNMLLHSRAGSGERRVADINLLVEESLNLAYHGARAEKQGFNVTIERSLDPSAGEVDVLPQEITRVFLNLISNGFYATVKRKERASAAYEPILLAATRNLGDRVEIRIRDNGTGIPPEVKEKMFDPFFTTKPAGEGTGLGLSLSHDIVVKQHRGSIEVDTSPGEYTEFRIVLPRSAASPGNDEVRP
ncbi:MAG: GAF domain-containing protein [Microvirga sp.]